MQLREQKQEDDVTKHKLEDLRPQVSHDMTRDQFIRIYLVNHSLQMRELQVRLESEQAESQVRVDAMTVKKDAEIENLNRKLGDMRTRLESLEKDKMAALPPDALKEVRELKSRLAASESDCDKKDVEKAELSSKIRELIGRQAAMEKTQTSVKSHSSDAEARLKALRQEKDREVKRLQADADKKERERALQEKKKIAALEQKVCTMTSP